MLQVSSWVVRRTHASTHMNAYRALCTYKYLFWRVRSAGDFVDGERENARAHTHVNKHMVLCVSLHVSSWVL